MPSSRLRRRTLAALLSCFLATGPSPSSCVHLRETAFFLQSRQRAFHRACSSRSASSSLPTQRTDDTEENTAGASLFIPPSGKPIILSKSVTPRPKGPPPLVYHHAYTTPSWPSKHRFKMRKFTSLFLHLLRSGLAKRDEFFIPVEAPPPSWFTAVHCQEYFSDFVSGSLDEKRMRRIGLPWSPQLVRRTLVEAAGTVLSAQLACEFGIACSLGGGTHHAHHNFGSGFTIFNDVVIAADVVIKEGRASRVLIVDLDVHQGDGTAALASARPSKDVFALSFHCGANFPFRKETSDLDVSFERGAGDDEFLSKLREVLPSVLDSFGPDLVLYLSGVDPFEGDKLGLLNLSEDGLRERDLFVFRECTRRGVPVSGVIGGGYDDDVDKLAARHGLLFESAAQVWREAEGWGGRGVRRRESSEQRQQPESPQERKGDLGGGMRLERLESSSKLESLTSSPAANVSISSPLFSEKAVGSFVTPAVPAVSAVSTPLPVEI